MIPRLGRRAFCGQVCRVAAIGVSPALTGCGGGEASPAGPTSPGSPAAPVAGPLPSPAPAPLPAGPAPVPPPRAGVVVSLPLVDAVEIPGGFSIGVTGGSPLAEVWGSARTLATHDGIVRYVLLMRTGDSAFSALSATCTHEGCLVSGVDRPIFVCPCHGSRYDHTGAVVNGPAPAALPRYGTEFADGLLVVRF